MKSKLLKLAVFILIFVFYGSLLVYKITLPFADDMARHIKNGEMILHGQFNVLYQNFYSYTLPGQPFVNHHWLFGVIAYVLHQAIGWDGLIIFKAIVLLSAFVLLFLTAAKKANFWLVAFLSLPTLLILAGRSALRPEIFSYLFIALFLYLLTYLEEHPESKRVFWLIPIQLLWVSLHIYFIIGLALVAGFLLEKIIVNRKNFKKHPLVRKLFFLLVALAAVCFINPNGLWGALYPLQIFHNYGINVSENQSISGLLKGVLLWDNISVAIFRPAVLLLALSFFFGFRKKPIFYFLASASTAVIGFFLIRTLPFFAFIFLPAVSANFNEPFNKIKDWLKQNSPKVAGTLRKAFIFVLMATPFFLIFLNSSGKISIYGQPGIGLAPRSLETALFFKVNDLRGPIFNDYDIGSYLIYYLFPQEKVFVDNRPEAYSSSFFKDIYLPVFENEDAWQEVLKKYSFNVIILYQYDATPHVRDFLWRRTRDQDWSLVYTDIYSMIFLRNIPQNQEVIKKFGITPENAAQRLSYLAESPNFADQVSAADAFNLIGREDLGRAEFLKVTAKWPDKGKIWMTMGEWELANNEPSSPVLAMMFLDKAIATGYKTAEAYSFLGAAYARMNEPEKAKETLVKALKINPDRQDAKELLNAIQKDVGK
jgi:tetratricopeptide (TPR) repeat protein